MSNFDNGLNLSENKSPFASMLLILFFAIIGAYIIGGSIGLLAGYLFFNGDITEYLDIMSNMFHDKRFKIPAYLVQGVSSIIGFIIIPALFMVMYEKRDVQEFFTKRISAITILLAGIVSLAFMGFNSWFVEWNANMVFPEWLAGVEQFARNMENSAMQATEFLTNFETPGIFVLAFLVIAIVPGIGEELVFRGFIQNYLHRSFGNIHVGIWLSAIIFSAFHLQFFGFVPRMLLGALFGYMYYWSGNLLVPIIAHIVNNGATLIMVYLFQLGYFETDPMGVESTEGAPLTTFIISGVATIALLYYFRLLNMKRAT